MTAIKPSDHGIVVDYMETGIRYAISDDNYDVKVHRKVRDLEPGESVRGFTPLSKSSLGETSDTSTPSSTVRELTRDSSDSLEDTQTTTKNTNTK